MKNNRTNKILEILSVQEKADVVSLAEICHVSQVTMRKDLDGLEDLGLVKRMHGYAMINNTDDLRGRLSYHYEEKIQIAMTIAIVGVGAILILDFTSSAVGALLLL